MARAIKREIQRRAAEASRRQGAVIRRSGLAAGAAAGAFVLSAPAAQAATFQVTTNLDQPDDAECVADCTLREAIGRANASAEDDDITFHASVTGTIRLTQGVELTTTGNYDVAIHGPGAGVLTINADADNDTFGDSRIFRLGDDGNNDSGDFSIEGLTLTKGATAQSGGAIYTFSSFSDVTLTGVTVTGNTSTGSGAGVHAGDEDSNLTITDSTISGNSAGSIGGGIIAGGPFTMSNSTVSGNTAANGGGGVFVEGKYMPMQITDSTLSGNHATGGDGGGIAIDQGSKYDGSRQDIVDTTISGNTASGMGAGAFFRSIDAANRVRVLRSTITGNQGGPSSFGGGIGVNARTDGTIAVVDSTVSGNSASVGGGVSLGRDTLTRIVGDVGEIEFNNSTIADNSATSRAGGIYLNQYDPGTGNTSATIPLNSTIVGDNTAGGSAQDLDRADGSGGGGFDTAFSLIENKGDAPLISSGPNQLGIDPKLGPLTNNGGPTLTQAPEPSSKAVDKGDSSRLAVDQRGFARLVDLGIPNAPTGNGTDIGAVELRASELPNNGKCAGKQATIIGASKTIKGTKGPDVILGTSGKNVIRGRGGADRICGLGANDRLIGGGGPDRLIGGKGKDRLIGGPGRDQLKGGPGRDVQRQ